MVVAQKINDFITKQGRPVCDRCVVNALKLTPDQYRTALARAISTGWIWRHESGTYLKFTESGAALFA
jgi:hypothetical protein